MTQALHTLLKPDVQRIFDHVSTCFNARIVFFNPAGELVSACRNRPDSTYCELVRAHLGSAESCRALDQAKCREASQGRALLCYQCHAGLFEAVKPLYHREQFLGCVMLGQLRTADNIPPAVRKAWIATGRASADLEDAYAALPQVSPEQRDALLDLFAIMVDYIVAQQMISVAPHRELETILTYLEAHIAEEITLEDVAHLIHKRPTTVSHLFTRLLGQSFKRTLLELKLRHAESYLRAHPTGTVTEAATAAGFSDPFYFSRLYKRYRGVPPSAFLTVCRELGTNGDQQ